MEKLRELERDFKELEKKEKRIMEKMKKAGNERKWDLEYKYECDYFAIGELLNMKYLQIQDRKKELGMETLHKFYIAK